MGGGKGSIDHYVTPIKAGRVIIEIGGHCEYFEVGNIFFTSFEVTYPDNISKRYLKDIFKKILRILDSVISLLSM